MAFTSTIFCKQLYIIFPMLNLGITAAQK